MLTKHVRGEGVAHVNALPLRIPRQTHKQDWQAPGETSTLTSPHLASRLPAAHIKVGQREILGALEHQIEPRTGLMPGMVQVN